MSTFFLNIFYINHLPCHINEWTSKSLSLIFLGLIVDKTGSYVPAFSVSAIYLFIGATIPFALCCLRKKKTSSIVEMQLTSDELPPERETVV